MSTPQEAPGSGQAPHAPGRGRIIISLVLMVLIALSIWYFWDLLWEYTLRLWELLKDKETFRARIESYGVWAPVVFILLQIFQVLASPIPGELVGPLGGYVFGWFPSLIYSTIGLSLGSWINFFVARLLGKSLVERLVPASFMQRITFLMERQGVIASFICFVIPGFPKDYFSYALGISPINWRVFMVVSSLGRVPGTLLLSIQGAMIYQERYWSFLVLGILGVAMVVPVWLWRERIYQLLYKLEKKRETS